MQTLKIPWEQAGPEEAGDGILGSTGTAIPSRSIGGSAGLFPGLLCLQAPAAPRGRGQAACSAWLALKPPSKSYLLPRPGGISGSSRVLSPAETRERSGRHRQQREAAFLGDQQ